MILGTDAGTPRVGGDAVAAARKVQAVSRRFKICFIPCFSSPCVLVA